METYQGQINEFIDWTTGINNITGTSTQGVNEDVKISGKSIRELLLQHLITPFVTNNDDPNKDKIYFFSSETAKGLWRRYTDPNDILSTEEDAKEKANSLILFEMDLPATYTITGLDVNDFLHARYIIEGNSNSENSRLNFTLLIKDALGTFESDVITVAYTITDSSNNINYKDSQQVETGVAVNKNIYRYLKPGDNVVTITASANNHSAKTTRDFHIYLVKFSLSSNFRGYYTGVSNGVNFLFDLDIKRSITNLPIITNVFIDNITNENNPVYTWLYSGSNSNPTQSVQIQNVYNPSDYNDDVTHTLVVRSHMEDPDTGLKFYSNILVYLFLVASSLPDLVNSFVNTSYSVPYNNYSPINESNKVVLQATQYIPFTLDWGYYTDSGLPQQNVTWCLRKTNSGETTDTELGSILGVKGEKPASLVFIPTEPLLYDEDDSLLVAKINNEDVCEFPINVAENNIDVQEKENYTLKLSAYGKTNMSTSRNQWTDIQNNVTTQFYGVPFDNVNGWDNNSLTLKGTSSYAIIDYTPFPETYGGNPYSVFESGATFEVDFKPEYVSSNDDILMSIGLVDSLNNIIQNAPHIEITPNSASYFEDGQAKVKTNFKSGERIKLCFVFNKATKTTNDAGLIYIINNGILERIALKGAASVTNNNAKIKIGGSNSSIRVYTIRAYRQEISPKLELDNYMFDNMDNATLISRNDIYKNSDVITYSSLLNKNDIITIEGDLTNILRNRDSKENATVTLKRESNSDSDKNFSVIDCRIRNHGQSTLSYPITSMKVWFNKSNKFIESVVNNLTVRSEVVPTFSCSQQAYLNLNKNRYIMKDGAIPSNKFVLLANYADSSGSHNGSLLRLILDTWYNAIFPGNEFKLRTDPLLFTSGMKVTHNDPNLNEDGSWEEGVSNVTNAEFRGKTWSEITGSVFPYKIRVAADSFPCVVFYKDTSTEDQEYTLLGQYVFMDDKKSDFIYGERSIYKIEDLSDPFCLKIENSKKDKNANKVWDNSHVLLIEVVYPNSPLTGYVSKQVADTYEIDEETLQLTPSGNVHRFDDASTVDLNGNVTSYVWELHFELIYPDKEDITDSNGNFDSAKFTTTVTPFMLFLEWITDCKLNYSTSTNWWTAGLYSSTQEAFEATAHDHLDMYKLAAYYIFLMRFGLVDSVERNAQLKTYDGQHWHYEPWDMDIALGCANNGVIAFDPPMTRNTQTAGGTYAFSGRTSTQSNTLWDCLENWDYWANTIVPNVAQALYDAGLTYDNAILMFDNEYVEKWSESLYNESGQFKYINATANDKYRKYLNGARTSHRHWWLSTSMNYYDAKWSCGDFTKYSITFRIDKPINAQGDNIVKIYPTSNTFFKAQYGTVGSESGVVPIGDLTEASPAIGRHAEIDFYQTLDKKSPCFIFGANSIESIDLSNLISANVAMGYTDIGFGGCYDNILGARLRSVKLGARCTPDIYTYPNETQYTSNLTVGENSIASMNEAGDDAFENLEHLDVIGWNAKLKPEGSWLSSLMQGHKNIKTLYALGCDHATEFLTSSEGNSFEDLRLPSSIRTIRFTNSKWDNISFWETTEIERIDPQTNETIVTSATYDKVDIPSTITEVIIEGSTGKNECSLQFVLDWIDSIEATLPVNHTEDDLLNKLENYTLTAQQILWGTGTTKLYYRDVIRLSKFRKNTIYNITGYAVISDQDNLTAIQLSNLLNAFGINVFNIGTTNTNLVIDQSHNFVTISTNAVYDSTLQSLTVSEPSMIRCSATKFTLSTALYTNYIIDNVDHTSSWFMSTLPESTYMWGLSATPTTLNETADQYKSASLRKLATGAIVIDLGQGDYGDYDFYINVFYYDPEEQDVNYRIKHDYVKIHVFGVTYPTSILFTTSSYLRNFIYTSANASDLFGQSVAQMSPLPPAYIMSSRNLKVEFYLDITGLYTATINSINFYIQSIDNPSYLVGPLSYTDVTGGSSEIISVDPLNTYQIGYSTDASNEGIMVNVIENPAVNMQSYIIYALISIGGRSIQRISAIIINYADEAIINRNLSSNLYLGIRNSFRTIYSNDWDGSVYKSDIINFKGSIDFESYPISSLLCDNGGNLLQYCEKITNLSLKGSTSLAQIPTQALINLVSLNIENCSGLSGNIDLTHCSYLLEVKASGTSVNVLIPQNSIITKYELGSPTSISIISPTTLRHSNVTVDDSTNITDIDIENMGTNEGFNTFANIMNLT